LLFDATAHEAALSAGSHSSDIVQAVASVHDIDEATATAFQIMLDERVSVGPTYYVFHRCSRPKFYGPFHPSNPFN